MALPSHLSNPDSAGIWPRVRTTRTGPGGVIQAISIAAALLVSAWCSPDAAAADKDDPQTELESFQIADGYEVNLFASEKDGVANPIQMRWDARGRLYVACSWAYPQLEPGQQPDDKIIRLEDTYGQGRAERAVVFARGLLMPEGLEWGDGGLYVGQSTELLHLKDTNGDGRADERRVVLRGFGTGDSHQNINSFSWSPGGELFFSQGLHAFSRVETPWGIERLHQAGIWRLRPRRLRLDPFFGDGLAPHNPWGFAFDDWGQPFLVAGNGHGIYYLPPALIRSGHFAEYPPLWNQGRKYCGADIVGSSHLPGDLQENLICGGFLNNTVFRFGIEEEGAGFRLKELAPLIVSTNQSFRPVDVKVGPDGAIYIADWYNPIIGHYQASFRDPNRDKTHGRIWRMTAKNRPLVAPPKLADAPTDKVLDQLKSPERWNRYQAKRVLADRDTQSVVNALANWMERLNPDAAAYEHHLFEALGVYETHEVIEPRLLEQLLQARDYRARAYATSVIGRWQDRLSNPLELLGRQIRDPYPRVRLEAIISCSYIPDARAIEVAAQAVDQPMDRFIQFALSQTVHALAQYWKPAFARGEVQFGNDPRRLQFVLQADGSPDTLKSLSRQLASPDLPAAVRENILLLIANAGTPQDLARLLRKEDVTSNGAYDAAAHARILTELAKASRLRNMRPAGDPAAALNPLLDESNSAVQRAALELAGTWKIETLRPKVVDIATSTNASLELRASACATLTALGGEQSKDTLVRLSNENQPADVRAAAIAALAGLDLDEAARRAAKLFSQPLPDAAAADLFKAFFRRASGERALEANLEDPSADAAKIGLRVMTSTGRQDPALWKLLNHAAGINVESAALSDEELRALINEVQSHGDAARGELIFRQAQQNCFACHAIGGAGGQIGPDLSALGSGQPVDFIIGAVLFPNREVKEGYLATEITTRDGQSFYGYKLREGPQEVVLRDVLQNQEVRIATAQIAEQQPRGSVMPAGLTANLTRAELRDLMRFLSELGKPGPYTVSSAPLVRRWQVLNGEGAGTFIPAKALAGEWTTVYSRVSGELALADLPINAGASTAIVKGEVEVTAPGDFQLALNSAAGLKLWVDDAPVPVKSQVRFHLGNGRHSVVFMIDLRQENRAALRVELSEVAGGHGRLRIINSP